MYTGYFNFFCVKYMCFGGAMMLKMHCVLSLLPLLINVVLSASPAAVSELENTTSPDLMLTNLTAGGPIPQ